MDCIEANLNYSYPSGERHYFIERKLDDNEAKENVEKGAGSGVTVAVAIQNARNNDDIRLNTAGFELFNQVTSLSTNDFLQHPHKITSTYFEEMRKLIKSSTGAEHVWIFAYRVRGASQYSDPSSTSTITSMSKVDPDVVFKSYAGGIHSDTNFYDVQRLLSRFNEEECEKDPEMRRFLQGRFMYVNAWRNIKDKPIEDNGLAFCDDRSVIKPDDYIVHDTFSQDSVTQSYRLSFYHHQQHQWYYYPKMTKDEVVFIKHFDSDTTIPGRICFHTAFHDPNAAQDADERMSIEVRTLAFFPDHQPNTMISLEAMKQALTNVPRTLANPHFRATRKEWKKQRKREIDAQVDMMLKLSPATPVPESNTGGLWLSALTVGVGIVSMATVIFVKYWL